MVTDNVVDMQRVKFCMGVERCVALAQKARRHKWRAASCGAMGPLAIQFPTGALHIHCRRYRRNVSPSEIASPS